MLNVAPWRVVMVIVAAIAGLVFSLPNLLPAGALDRAPVLSGLQRINLGLDLQGGSHLLLGVDTPALLKQEMETVVDEMARALRDEKPAIAVAGRGVVNGAARVTLSDPTAAARAIEILGKKVDTPISSGNFGAQGSSVSFTEASPGVIEARYTEAKVEATIQRAVSQSIEVIRRRIDPTGVNEVTIARQGQDRIIVQAPGVSDPETLKRRIGQTARMTFHLVNETADIGDAMAGRAPPGSEVLPQDDPGEPAIVVYSRALLTGDDLNRADPSFDPQTGEPVVSFRFDNRGTRIFGRETQRNVGKRFAVVLDGKALTAPVIREPIIGGSGQISGNFTVESAKELADLLNAGALPAPLSILEQRTVGAGLGKDAVQAGATAGVVAGIAIFVFMLLAYGIFGVIACIALIVNFFLIIGSMSFVGAALTLPGIAGLILTIAIAVDANVLIYERMRDEERLGRGPALAIDAGFSRAIVTIMDANITTLLAAAILFQFGVGPVRGFAWTLSIGTITSVFTAVFVTQVIIAWWFRTTRPRALPI